MAQRKKAEKSCRRVLVVDDDQGIRESLMDLLELEGFETACATNGQEALEALRSGPEPCVVFLDLMMPVMDGWQVLASRQSDPRLRKIPVVVITAARKLGEAAQAEKVLRKPFPVEDVIEAAKQFC